MEMTRAQTITGPGPDRHALSTLDECGCRECRRVMTYVAQMPAVLTPLRRYVERADQTLATPTPSTRATTTPAPGRPGPPIRLPRTPAVLRDVED
jgi:hypothetical protein